MTTPLGTILNLAFMQIVASDPDSQFLIEKNSQYTAIGLDWLDGEAEEWIESIKQGSILEVSIDVNRQTYAPCLR